MIIIFKSLCKIVALKRINMFLKSVLWVKFFERLP